MKLKFDIEYLIQSRINCIIICLQLSMIGIFVSSILGYELVILRTLIGFIFLSFIPGIIILKILNINNLNITKLVLFSIGLSILFIMFVGLFVNTLAMYLSISKPLSFQIILPIFILITIIMFLLSLNREDNLLRLHMDTTKLSISEFNILLFVFILPIFAIISTKTIELSYNNTLLMMFFFTVSLIPFMVIFDKIPSKFFPLILFSISLSMLYHYTVLTPNPVGCDIHTEYFFQNQVLTNLKWDYNTYVGSVNAMLSIVMLGPIYSIILGMNLVWISKLIYPFIFSLVPVALFEIYRNFLTPKKAFISVFFIMSIFTFFTEMTALLRQQIAELFYVLFILLSIDKEIVSYKGKILRILFIAGIAVSHYGLTYIVMFILFMSFLFELIFHGIYSYLSKKEELSRISLYDNIICFLAKFQYFSFNKILVVLLFMTFATSWYLYVTPGPFLNMVHVSQTIFNGLSDFFKPTASQDLTVSSMGFDIISVSYIGRVYRVIHIITELLLIIGFIHFLKNSKRYSFNANYIALSFSNYLLLFMCVVLPHFSSHLNVTRLYHVILFLISPFLIIGYEFLSSKFKNVFSFFDRFFISIAKTDIKSSLLCITLILTLYFLFNTGFVLEITQNTYSRGDTPGSIVLNYKEVDGEYFNLQEVSSSNWLFVHSNNNKQWSIYADRYGKLLLNELFFGKVFQIKESQNNFDNSYVYFRSWNIDNNELFIQSHIGSKSKFTYFKPDEDIFINESINSKYQIYDNGGSLLYYS